MMCWCLPQSDEEDDLVSAAGLRDYCTSNACRLSKFAPLFLLLLVRRLPNYRKAACECRTLRVCVEVLLLLLLLLKFRFETFFLMCVGRVTSRGVVCISHYEREEKRPNGKEASKRPYASP
jgi:hypothetical protein